MKKLVSKIVLAVLNRAIIILSKKDSRVKKEVEGWKDGQCFVLKASPDGPRTIISKHNGKLIKAKSFDESAIVITFKSIDSAFLVLTGQLGVSGAYAEHRFTLRGEIGPTMSLMRIIEITESYLFPSFITKHCLKERIRKEVSSINIYLHLAINGGRV